jgi:hypothetical protein
MNIAFDYDDTLDLAYPLFSAITNSLIAAGHKVYIVTHIIEEYRTYRENQLKQYNIAYTELVITGDKMYECQKRGIEYIFDDCSTYFKDISPAHLQVFKIPPVNSKVLEDGTEVEFTARAIQKFSGFLTNYQFRLRKKNRKRWSDWEDLDGKLNDLKSQLGNFKSLSDLQKLWNKGD